MTQYLVQWEHQAAADATWEDEDHLRRNFPAFHLEDKVNEEREAIVTNVPVDQVKKKYVDERPRMSSRVNRGVTSGTKFKDFVM